MSFIVTVLSNRKNLRFEFHVRVPGRERLLGKIVRKQYKQTAEAD